MTDDTKEEKQLARYDLSNYEVGVDPCWVKLDKQQVLWLYSSLIYVIEEEHVNDDGELKGTVDDEFLSLMKSLEDIIGHGHEVKPGFDYSIFDQHN
jgi:hypothetical protein